MESTTDAADWKLEVERVLPQLKVTIRTDNKVTTLLSRRFVLYIQESYILISSKVLFFYIEFI